MLLLCLVNVLMLSSLGYDMCVFIVSTMSFPFFVSVCPSVVGFVSFFEFVVFSIVRTVDSLRFRSFVSAVRPFGFLWMVLSSCIMCVSVYALRGSILIFIYLLCFLCFSFETFIYYRDYKLFVICYIIILE